MKCSNPDCEKRQPETMFGRMLNGEGIIREQKWYCDEHCFSHPILKDFILRKQSQREFHSSSYPVTAQLFGSTLVCMGKISKEQLESATIERFINDRLPIPHYLLKTGQIYRKDILEALGKIHRVPVAHLNGKELSQELIDAIPAQIARLGKVIPFSCNSATNHLSVLMRDPTDMTTIITLKRLTRYEITPFQGDPKEIEEAISKYYHSYATLTELPESEHEFAVAN